MRIWLWYDHPTKGWKNGRTFSGYGPREIHYVLWDAVRLWRAGLSPSVSVIRPGR